SPVPRPSTMSSIAPLENTPASASALVFYCIPQNANALDIDFANIARFHPERRFSGMPDARRRAHDDEVARLQRHALAYVNQRLDHRKHHVPRIVRLNGQTVKACLDIQARGTGRKLIWRNAPRAKTARTVEILPHIPLRAPALKVADRAVIETRIPGHAAERIGRRQMFRALADDDRKFGLIIEAIGHGRFQKRAPMRGKRGLHAHEDAGVVRPLRGVRAFRYVVHIVKPEANGLTRPRHGKSKADAIERMPRC